MFNRNADRTPKQKAEKAVMNILVRLAGCGLLIYFVVQLLTLPKEEAPDATTALILAIVLIVLSVGVIFMTVLDLINGLKNGRFKTETYEDAEILEYMARQEEAAAKADNEAQQEIEKHAEDGDEQPGENNNDEDLK